MKIFFVKKNQTCLSDRDPKTLLAIKENLLLEKGIEEVFNIHKADVIIIQEENSFKNFKYITDLESDEIISTYPEKVFTINSDDCATGLLRGLYTSLPKYRFNSSIHAIVPYMHFPNDLVFAGHSMNIAPVYLASWRGNTKSNRIRSKMVSSLKSKNGFYLETTNSWLNHDLDEKKSYVNLIRAAKFSLCPAGWAPVSFRIYESMALGRCPVIIADDFEPPKGPDWKDFAVFYPQKDINLLSSFLCQNEQLAKDYGKNAFEVWKRYFCADVVKEYYTHTLLSLIYQTPKTSKEAEFKRWRSLNMYWKNKWTIPQRILNKIR